MKIQTMSSALRVTMSAREADAIRATMVAGIAAMGILAPDAADDILAMIDIGAHGLRAKQAEARARKKASSVRLDVMPHRNLLIDGFTISANRGDWIDVSPDPDDQCWIKATEERSSGQHEIRRDVWHVSVLNPDPFGSLYLASACTQSGDDHEIEAVATRLVAEIMHREMAA